MSRHLLLSVLCLALGVRSADAVSMKLVVLDKLATAGRAKVTFSERSGSVSLGSGLDIETVEAELVLAYPNGAAVGSFSLPAGSANGWFVSGSGLVFKNPSAPGGPTQTKVAVIRPPGGTGTLKLVAKGLGDVPLDIFGAGDPGGRVYASYCVDNGSEEVCHCRRFVGCVYQVVAGGTGAKLKCKAGHDDSHACRALCGGSGFVDTGLTVQDTCVGLEWGKKDGADGVPGLGTADPGNPHDVDNTYVWAGGCSLNSSVLCQPTAAAESACRTQTNAAVWQSGGCNQCGVADGTCVIAGALTTVWDWVAGLNAASFAGHADWRLPTVSQIGLTGEAAEAESIIDLDEGECAGGIGGCIDPVFGPAGDSGYWSGTTHFSLPDGAYTQHGGGSAAVPKTLPFPHVRAVRSMW